MSDASVTPAPTIMPAGYERHGLEAEVTRKFGCETAWVQNYHVHREDWNGFVYQFELIGHPSAKTCFVLWARDGQGRRVYVYAREGDINDPADAARMMLSGRRGYLEGSGES